MTCLKKISLLVVAMMFVAVVCAAENTAPAAAAAPAPAAEVKADAAKCTPEQAAACGADKAKCGTTQCPVKAADAAAPVAAAAEVKTEAAAAAEVKPVDNRVAATAGDIKVTVAEVDQIVAPRLKNIPDQVKETQSALIKKRALDSIIFQKLLEKKFEENKIVVDDVALDAEITKILADNNITVEDFKKRVVEMGRDFNEFRDQVRNGMKYQKMMDSLADGKFAVTDEEIKAYYDQNADRFAQPEEVKASHILVKVAPEATAEDKAAAKAKIDALLVRVKAGEDFAVVAKEASDCPSKENGGDLGFFTRDRMVQPFSDVAFGLEKGKMSDVVETQFGYHIILATDKKEAKTISFDEATADIKTQLEDGKRREFAGKFREDLLKSSNIVYYDEFRTEEKPAEIVPVQAPAKVEEPAKAVEPAKTEEVKPAAK